MKTDLAPIFNAKAAEFGAKAVENGLNEIFQYCICKTLRTLRGTLRTLRLIDVECKK